MKQEATARSRRSSDSTHRQAKAYRIAVTRYLALITITITTYLCLSVSAALGQETTFTYQGRLQDGSAAANGSYDFQFTLWDAMSGGTQQPPPSPITVTRTSVQVASGVFTTQLDFGANAFPGPNRYLEISVRLAGSGAFTILSPRQQITSTPYAVRSLTASSADNVPVSGVPSGSGNYIQNTTSQQASTNFNISGNGTAGGALSGNVVNATNSYNIGNVPMLRIPGLYNLFAGANAGLGNTTGSSNTLVGARSGFSNQAGNYNSFFGNDAGLYNNTGSNNTFVGSGAGQYNASGSSNTFIGRLTGSPYGSNVSNSTAIGAGAAVSANYTIVLGTNSETTRIPGVLSVGSDTATTRGQINLLSRAGNANLYLQPADLGYGINFGVEGSAPNATLFIAQYDGTTKNDRLVITAWGTVVVPNLGGAGSTQLCRNAGNEISSCSSSLRYKRDVALFRGGFDIINRLRPISFTWKEGGTQDVGLAAEEVAKVDPLLTFRNDKGEIEGVKYDQLSAVFINAFKEQQTQIKQQQEQLQRQQEQISRHEEQARQQRAMFALQQQQIEALKKLVCRSNGRAAVCE